MKTLLALEIAIFEDLEYPIKYKTLIIRPYNKGFALDTKWSENINLYSYCSYDISSWEEEYWAKLGGRI